MSGHTSLVCLTAALIITFKPSVHGSLRGEIIFQFVPFKLRSFFRLSSFRSFVHSFVRSLVRPFHHSFVPSIVSSMIRRLIDSLFIVPWIQVYQFDGVFVSSFLRQIVDSFHLLYS